MSLAMLAKNTCVSATVHLPSWGLWWADCELDTEVQLSGRVDLVMADLTLKGSIVSGGPWVGRSQYRIVGGAGGWCRPLKAKGYVNDAGVKYSAVFGDAAAECGETIQGAPAGTCGPAFARTVGPASTVLNLLAPQSWYMGEDGVTRFGARPTVALPKNITRGKSDFSTGSIELLPESIAQILPGATLDGLSAVDVVHTIDGKKLRSTIYGTHFGTTSKRLLAWSKLIEQMRPFERFRGVWEYRVVYQVDNRLDLQPATTRFGLPDLRSVRVVPGVAGCKAELVLGSLVLVSFVNADPCRPVVTGFADADSPGFVPDRLDLVGEDDLALTVPNPIGRVLRYGDVVCMPTGPTSVSTPYVLTPIPSPPTAPMPPGLYVSASRVRA